MALLTPPPACRVILSAPMPVSTTTAITVAAPEAESAFTPGVYVTDGCRLFRVVSPGASLFPSADLEDCHTLRVERYYSDELYAMHLKRVPPAACADPYP